MRTLFYTTFFSFVFCLTANAADTCSDPQDQASMTGCADQDFHAADTKLNKQYKEIEKRLLDDDDTKKMLLKAQRDWVSFRDAECAFQASGADGGSAYPMVYAQCATALTNTRLADFEAYLKCEEGDMSCPVPAPD